MDAGKLRLNAVGIKTSRIFLALSHRLAKGICFAPDHRGYEKRNALDIAHENILPKRLS
jgi:hypothetical protein